MNKYAIITSEGFCTSPEGDEIENCQFLGRIMAESKEEAISKFWKESFVATDGYDITEAIAIQLHETEWV